MKIRIHMKLPEVELNETKIIRIRDDDWKAKSTESRRWYCYNIVFRDLEWDFRTIIEKHKSTHVQITLEIPAFRLSLVKTIDVVGEDWQDMDFAERYRYCRETIFKSMQLTSEEIL